MCFEEDVDVEKKWYATNKEERLEELGDVLETVFSLAKLEDVSELEILKIRKEKREKRGGFDKRIYLIKVEEL